MPEYRAAGRQLGYRGRRREASFFQMHICNKLQPRSFFPLLRFFVPDSSSAFRSCSFSGKTACHPSRSLDWERSSLVRPRPALPSSRFPLVYVEAVSLSLARSLGRSSFLLLHCAVAILNFLVPLPCFLPPHHPPSLCILLSSSASSFSSCRA